MPSFLDGTDDYVSWANYSFPAMITDRKEHPTILTPEGMKVWVHEWKEQILKPDNLGYEDLDGGRVGTIDDCFALEENDIPTPLGTLVWLRLRGVQAGTQVYEFRNPIAWFGTWVRLTEYHDDEHAFDWEEVYPAPTGTWDGTWLLRPGGLSGEINAYEVNDTTDSIRIGLGVTDVIVWLWLAHGTNLEPRWVFFNRELTLSDNALVSTVIPHVTYLEIESTFGLKLNILGPGPGRAQIAIGQASLTQPGVVTTGFQQMIGTKWLTGSFASTGVLTSLLGFEVTTSGLPGTTGYVCRFYGGDTSGPYPANPSQASITVYNPTLTSSDPGWQGPTYTFDWTGLHLGTGSIISIGGDDLVGSDGLIGLGSGGAGSDLSGTGPGVLLQGGVGDALTVGPIPLGDLNYVGGVLGGDNGGTGLALSEAGSGFLMAQGTGVAGVKAPGLTGVF